MELRGLFYAIQAGFFAALASVCAKIATSSNSASYFSSLLTKLFEILFELQLSLPLTGTQVSLIIRCVGVAGIFLCNALMWVLFTKSMHLCSSTLEATAFNTASNFFFTAFLGFFLFGERIELQWYTGSILMVIGLVILHKSSSSDVNEAQDEQRRSSQYQTGDRVDNYDYGIQKDKKKS